MADNTFEYTYSFKPAQIDLGDAEASLKVYENLSKVLASVKANADSVTSSIGKMGKTGQQSLTGLNAQATSFSTEIAGIQAMVDEASKTFETTAGHYYDSKAAAGNDAEKTERAYQYREKKNEEFTRRAQMLEARTRDIVTEGGMYGLADKSHRDAMNMEQWDPMEGMPVFDMKKQQAALESYSQQTQAMISKWMPQLSARINAMMGKFGNPISSMMSDLNTRTFGSGEEAQAAFEDSIASITSSIFMAKQGDKKSSAAMKIMPSGMIKDMVKRQIDAGGNETVDQESYNAVRNMIQQAVLAAGGSTKNPVLNTLASSGATGGKMPTTIQGLMAGTAFEGLFEKSKGGLHYAGRDVVKELGGAGGTTGQGMYFSEKGKAAIAKLVSSNPEIARAVLTARMGDGKGSAGHVGYRTSGMGIGLNLDKVSDVGGLMDALTRDFLIKLNGQSDNPNAEGESAKLMPNLMSKLGTVKSGGQKVTDYISSLEHDIGHRGYGLGGRTTDLIKAITSGAAISPDDEEALKSIDGRIAAKALARLKNGGSAGAVMSAATQLMEIMENPENLSFTSTGSTPTITTLGESAREKQTQFLVEKLMPFKTGPKGGKNEAGLTTTIGGTKVPVYSEWTPMSENGFSRALGIGAASQNEKTSLIKEISMEGFNVQNPTDEDKERLRQVLIDNGVIYKNEKGEDVYDEKSPYVFHTSHGQGKTGGITARLIRRDAYEEVERNFAKGFSIPFAREYGLISDEDMKLPEDELIKKVQGTVGTFWNNMTPEHGVVENGSIPKFAKEVDNRNKRWSPGVDMAGTAIDWLHGGVDQYGNPLSYSDISSRFGAGSTDAAMDRGGRMPRMALVDFKPLWERQEKGSKLFGFDSASEGEGYVNREFMQSGTFQGRGGFGGKGMFMAMDDIAKTLAVAQGGEENYTVDKDTGNKTYRVMVPSAFGKDQQIELTSTYDANGNKIGSNYDAIVDASAQKDKGTVQMVYDKQMELLSKEHANDWSPELIQAEATRRANLAYSTQMAATGLYAMNRADNDKATDNLGVQAAQWIRFSPGVMQHQAEALNMRLERLKTPEGMAEVFGGENAKDNFYAQGLTGHNAEISNPREFYLANQEVIDQKVSDYRDSLLRRSTSGEYINHESALGAISTLGKNAVKIDNARVLTNPWTAMLASKGITEEKTVQDEWAKLIDAGKVGDLLTFDENGKVAEGGLQGMSKEQVYDSLRWLKTAQKTFSSATYGNRKGVPSKMLTGAQTMGVVTMTGYGKEGDKEYLPAGFVDFDRPDMVTEAFARSPTGLGQVTGGVNYAALGSGYAKAFRKLSGQNQGVLFNMSTMQQLAGADWDGDMIKVMTSSKYDMKNINKMRAEAGLSELKSSKDVFSWLGSTEADGYQALRKSGKIGGDNNTLVDDVLNSVDLLKAMGIYGGLDKGKKGSLTDAIEGKVDDINNIRPSDEGLTGDYSTDLVNDLIRRGQSPILMGKASSIGSRLSSLNLSDQTNAFWTQMALESNRLYDVYTTNAKRPQRVDLDPKYMAAMSLGAEFGKADDVFAGKYGVSGSAANGYKDSKGNPLNYRDVFEHNGRMLDITGQDSKTGFFAEKNGGLAIDQYQMLSHNNKAHLMSALATGYLQKAGNFDDSMAELNAAFLTQDAKYAQDEQGNYIVNDNGEFIRQGGGLGFGMLDWAERKDGTRGLSATKKLVKNFRGLFGQNIGGKNMFMSEQTRSTLAQQMAEANDEINAYASELYEKGPDAYAEYLSEDDQIKLATMNGDAASNFVTGKIRNKIKKQYGFNQKEMALGGHQVLFRDSNGKVTGSQTIDTSMTIPALINSLVSDSGYDSSKSAENQSETTKAKLREASQMVARLSSVQPDESVGQLIDSTVLGGKTQSKVIQGAGLKDLKQNLAILGLDASILPQEYQTMLAGGTIAAPEVQQPSLVDTINNAAKTKQTFTYSSKYGEIPENLTGQERIKWIQSKFKEENDARAKAEQEAEERKRQEWEASRKAEEKAETLEEREAKIPEPIEASAEEKARILGKQNKTVKRNGRVYSASNDDAFIISGKRNPNPEVKKDTTVSVPLKPGVFTDIDGTVYVEDENGDFEATTHGDNDANQINTKRKRAAQKAAEAVKKSQQQAAEEAIPMPTDADVPPIDDATAAVEQIQEQTKEQIESAAAVKVETPKIEAPKTNDTVNQAVENAADKASETVKTVTESIQKQETAAIEASANADAKAEAEVETPKTNDQTVITNAEKARARAAEARAEDDRQLELMQAANEREAQREESWQMLDPNNPYDQMDIIASGMARNDAAKRQLREIQQFAQSHPNTTSQVLPIKDTYTVKTDEYGNTLLDEEGLPQLIQAFAAPNMTSEEHGFNKGTSKNLGMVRQLRDWGRAAQSIRSNPMATENEREFLMEYNRVASGAFGSAASNAWLAADQAQDKLNAIMGPGSASASIKRLNDIFSLKGEVQGEVLSAQNVLDAYKGKTYKAQDGSVLQNDLNLFVNEDSHAMEEAQGKIDAANQKLLEINNIYNNALTATMDNVLANLTSQEQSITQGITGIAQQNTLDQDVDARMAKIGDALAKEGTDLDQAVRESPYFDKNSEYYDTEEAERYRDRVNKQRERHKKDEESYASGKIRQQVTDTVKNQREAEEEIASSSYLSQRANLENALERQNRMKTNHLMNFLPQGMLSNTYRNWTQYKGQLQSNYYESLNTENRYRQEMLKYRASGQKDKEAQSQDLLTLAEKNTQSAAKSLGANSGIGGFAKQLGLSAIQSAVNKAKQLFKQLINVAKQFVNEWNNTMAGVSAKSGLSGEELDELGTQIQEQAQKLKVSSTSLANTYKTLFASGYDTSNIEHAAEVLTKFSTVTGQDASKSIKQLSQVVNSGLVSSLDEAMDKLTAISDLTVATTADVSKVLSKMSGNALSSGMTSDETFALATFAAESMGGNASVGSDLSMIISRLNNLSLSDSSDAFGTTQVFTDSEGREYDVEDIKALEKVSGVDFFRDSADGEASEMRSTYEILQDIASKWNDMSETTRASFTSMLGGTSGRQSNTFTTFMQAWANDPEKIQSYIEASENSNNTVNAQYATMMDTATANRTQAVTAFTTWISDITGGSNGWLADLRNNFWNAITGIFDNGPQTQKLDVNLSDYIQIQQDELTEKIDILDSIKSKYKDLTDTLSETDQLDVASTINSIAAAFPNLISASEQAVTTVAELVAVMQQLNDEKDRLTGEKATQGRENYDYSGVLDNYRSSYQSINNSSFVRNLNSDYDQTRAQRWLDFANAYRDNPNAGLDFGITDKNGKNVSNMLGSSIMQYAAYLENAANAFGLSAEDVLTNDDDMSKMIRNMVLKRVNHENEDFWNTEDVGEGALWSTEEERLKDMEVGSAAVGNLFKDLANNEYTYETMDESQRSIWDNLMAGAYEILQASSSAYGKSGDTSRQHLANSFLANYFGYVASDEVNQQELDELYNDTIDKMYSGIFANQTMDTQSQSYVKDYLKTNVFTKANLKNSSFDFNSYDADEIIKYFQGLGYIDENNLWSNDAYKQEHVQDYATYMLNGHYLLGDTKADAIAYYKEKYYDADKAASTVTELSDDDMYEMLQDAATGEMTGTTWADIINSANASSGTYKTFAKTLLNYTALNGIAGLDNKVSLGGTEFDSTKISSWLSGDSNLKSVFSSDYSTDAAKYDAFEKYYLGTNMSDVQSTMMTNYDNYKAMITNAEKMASGEYTQTEVDALVNALSSTGVTAETWAAAVETGTEADLIEKYKQKGISGIGSTFDTFTPYAQGFFDLNNYGDAEHLTIESQRARAEELAAQDNVQAQRWLDMVDYIESIEGLSLTADEETGALSITSDKYAATDALAADALKGLNALATEVNNNPGKLSSTETSQNLAAILAAGADWRNATYKYGTAQTASEALKSTYGEDLTRYLTLQDKNAAGLLTEAESQEMTELQVSLTFKTYGVQEAEHAISDLQQKCTDLATGGSAAAKSIIGVMSSGATLTQRNAAANALAENDYNLNALDTPLQEFITSEISGFSNMDAATQAAALQEYYKTVKQDVENWKADVELFDSFREYEDTGIDTEFAPELYETGRKKLTPAQLAMSRQQAGLSGDALYASYGFDENAQYNADLYKYSNAATGQAITSSTVSQLIDYAKSGKAEDRLNWLTGLSSFVNKHQRFNEAVSLMTDEEGNIDPLKYQNLRDEQRKLVKEEFNWGNLTDEEIINLDVNSSAVKAAQESISSMKTEIEDLKSASNGEIDVGLDADEIAEATAAIEEAATASSSIDMSESFLGQIDTYCQSIAAGGMAAAEALQTIYEKMNQLSQSNAISSKIQEMLNGGTSAQELMEENPDLLAAILSATGLDYADLTGANAQQYLQNYVDKNDASVKAAENDVIKLKAAEYNEALAYADDEIEDENGLTERERIAAEARAAGFVLNEAGNHINTSASTFGQNINQEYLDRWMAEYGYDADQEYEDASEEYGYHYDTMKNYAKATGTNARQTRLGILNDFVDESQQINEANDIISRYQNNEKYAGKDIGDLLGYMSDEEKEVLAKAYGYSDVEAMERNKKGLASMVEQTNRNNAAERNEMLSGYASQYADYYEQGETEQETLDNFAEAILNGKIENAPDTLIDLATAYQLSGESTDSSVNAGSLKSQFESLLNNAGSLDEVVEGVNGNEELLRYINSLTELKELYNDIKKGTVSLSEAQQKYSKQIGHDASTLNTYKKEFAKLRENIDKTESLLTKVKNGQVKKTKDEDGNYSDELKDIASLLGLDEDTIAKMTDGELADMLTSELDDLGQQYAEKLQEMADSYGEMSVADFATGMNDEGAMEYQIGDIHLVAGEVTTMGLSEAISLAQSLGQDALVAELSALSGYGGEVQLDTWVDEAGNIHAAYNGVELTGAGSGGSSSSGGGGGGGGESATSKLLKKWKHKTTASKHVINVAKAHEEIYQEQGNLAQYGKELEYENVAQENYIATQKKAIAAYEKQMKKVSKESDDWWDLAEAIQEAEEEILSAEAAIEKNTKALEENRKAMRKTRTDLEDYIVDLLEANEQYEDGILEGTISMQDTILDAIKQRYEDEWELQQEDLEKKREALEEEKDMIDERLQARKDAEDAADAYEEVAELQKQLALISMDSSRAAEAEQIRQQLAEKTKELAWQETEDIAAARSEELQNQIDSIDEYIDEESERIDEYLNNDNNFATEVASILSGSEEDIINWLKNNVDEYSDYLEEAQQKQVESWRETYESMLGITETFWEQAQDIISGGWATVLQEVIESQDYINASDTEKYQLIMDAKELYEAYTSAFKTSSLASDYDDKTAELLKELEDAINSGDSAALATALNNYTAAATGTAAALDTHSWTPTYTLDDATSKSIEDTSSNTQSIATSTGQILYLLTSLGNGGVKIGSAAEGGVFDYTGQVTVHGTNEHPEYIFNEDQLKALSKIGYTPYNTSVNGDATGSSTNIGDVTITINQASIASDLDVERLAEEVGERFVQQISVQGYRTGRF